MKSKILHKPELIVVALLLLLLCSSVASAADVISTHAIGNYLTGEAMYILQVLVVITFAIGLIMILAGSWGHNAMMKTRGYAAVGGVVFVVALYYIVPGIIGTLDGMSSSSTVFEFGGGSSNNSSGFGGGY